MATRNEVLQLFGASPEMIMQRDAQRQAEMLQQMQNPYQQVGTAIGVGLGRLFGGESAEVTQARQMQEALQGIDPTDPNQLREAAKVVSSFSPGAAFYFLSEAQKLETPETRDIYQSVQVPQLDPITRKPTGEMETKSIRRTGVFVNGKFTGYLDEQGNTVSPQAESTVGILDTPKAKASREQAGAVDLGGGVTLTVNGKTPVTDDQLEAARTGQTTTPQTTTQTDEGPILPKDKFPVEPGATDIKRGVTTEAETDPEGSVATGEKSDFTTTPLQRRDEAIAKLQQEDTKVLLRLLRDLNRQLTLTFEDQELIRIITSELADRKKAPQQKKR